MRAEPTRVEKETLALVDKLEGFSLQQFLG
jgi:hypothetical protein